MVAYEFTENEIHGIYYLASIGFANLMRNSNGTDSDKQKDAEIIRLSSINGLQTLGDEGFNAALMKLDDLRVEFFGSTEEPVPAAE